MIQSWWGQLQSVVTRNNLVVFSGSRLWLTRPTIQTASSLSDSPIRSLAGDDARQYATTSLFCTLLARNYPLAGGWIPGTFLCSCPLACSPFRGKIKILAKCLVIQLVTRMNGLTRMRNLIRKPMKRQKQSLKERDISHAAATIKVAICTRKCQSGYPRE